MKKGDTVIYDGEVAKIFDITDDGQWLLLTNHNQIIPKIINIREVKI